MVHYSNQTLSPPPPSPAAAPLLPALPPLTHSVPPAAAALLLLPSLPAPASQPHSQNWCAALHAVSLSRSASPPRLLPATRLSAALPADCCKTGSPAPTGPETTIAAAQTTMLAARHPPAAPAAAPVPRPAPRAPTPPPAAPTPPPSAAQKWCVAAPPPETLPAPARSTASPTVNGPPTRRSSPPAPLLPRSAPRSTTAPATLPQASAVPPYLCFSRPTLPAPATLCGLLCRSVSAATGPAAPSRSVPCSPATAPPDSCATQLRSALLLGSPHRPPAAPLLRRPGATAPHSQPHSHDCRALLRSRPTQCGSRVASPARPAAPHTRCCHPLDSAPDHQCGTSVLRRCRCSGPAESALPSTPPAPDSHALPRRRRYRSRPPPPPPPLPAPGPGCRPARYQSAAQSWATAHRLHHSAAKSHRPSSPLAHRH